MTNAVISVEDYVKSYPGRLAVDGLSFEVQAGEVLGLVS
jgi:ABC-type multidrug transport system ATPase subunit